VSKTIAGAAIGGAVMLISLAMILWAFPSNNPSGSQLENIEVSTPFGSLNVAISSPVGEIPVAAINEDPIKKDMLVDSIEGGQVWRVQEESIIYSIPNGGKITSATYGFEVSLPQSVEWKVDKATDGFRINPTAQNPEFPILSPFMIFGDRTAYGSATNISIMISEPNSKSISENLEFLKQEAINSGSGTDWVKEINTQIDGEVGHLWYKVDSCGPDMQFGCKALLITQIQKHDDRVYIVAGNMVRDQTDPLPHEIEPALSSILASFVIY